MIHFLGNFSEKPGAQPYVTSPPPRRAIEENANLFFFVFSVFDLGEVQIALLLIFWVFRRNRNFWSRLVKNGQNCIFRNFRFFRKFRSNALIIDILLFFWNLQKTEFAKIGQNSPPGSVGQKWQKVIDLGQMSKIWGAPPGGTPGVPDQVFRKNPKKYFFIFYFVSPDIWHFCIIFGKNSEFPGDLPGGNFDHVSQILDCFFVVYHQFTGVMSKNGEFCITCPPRSKIGQICQKTFFENFA